MRSQQLSGWGRWLALGVMIALALTTLYPMVYLTTAALKGKREYMFNKFGPPREPTLENIQKAWTGARVGRTMFNTSVVAVSGLLLSWAVCAGAAYALVFLDFPMRRKLFYFLLCSMMVAPPVILVPIYKMMNDLRLGGSFLGLVLVYVTFSIPFGTYLLTSYFLSLPPSLVEAAEMDGAGPARALWYVILPVARPAMVTLGIFNFLFMWNELLFALLLLQGEKQTLMVGLANLKGQYTTNIPTLCAGLLLSALPVLAVFLLFQAQLSKGMTLGAVK